MNESSTLVYLVNQIKSELLKFSLQDLPEIDPDHDRQDDFCNMSPSVKSLQTVLNYSRLLEVADTESVGKVEWMLN